MRINSIIFSIVALVIISCASEQQKNDSSFLNIYFDNVIKELKERKVSLVKYINLNGIQDTVFVDSLNWEKEFKLFTQYEITQKQLKQNYREIKTDSSISYISKIDKLPIQQLSLKNSEHNPSLELKIVSDTDVYSIEYQLELSLKKGYLIQSTQKTVLNDVEKLRIEGRFKK